jgi:mRNA interferase MazF
MLRRLEILAVLLVSLVCWAGSGFSSASAQEWLDPPVEDIGMEAPPPPDVPLLAPADRADGHLDQGRSRPHGADRQKEASEGGLGRGCRCDRGRWRRWVGLAEIWERGRRGPDLTTRGDVWLASLDPTIGSEIQKTRPCVVVSPAEINTCLRTVILAPLTTGSVLAPFRVLAGFGGKNGLIVLDQLRAVDKERRVRRLGVIDQTVLAEVLAGLRDTFED